MWSLMMAAIKPKQSINRWIKWFRIYVFINVSLTIIFWCFVHSLQKSCKLQYSDIPAILCNLDYSKFGNIWFWINDAFIIVFFLALIRKILIDRKFRRGN